LETCKKINRELFGGKAILCLFLLNDRSAQFEILPQIQPSNLIISSEFLC